MKLKLPKMTISTEAQNRVLGYSLIASLLTIAVLAIQISAIEAHQTLEGIAVSEAQQKSAERQLEALQTHTATITKYTKTGYRMASGKYPYVGAVATSDYSIPFGTKVLVNNCTFTVQDRTAQWVHDKHGLTLDFFTTNSNKEALVFGRKTVKYKKEMQGKTIVMRALAPVEGIKCVSNQLTMR